MGFIFLHYTGNAWHNRCHCCSIGAGMYFKSKSNHFYCHITTAQVPWWVKFLWACSRQCRKTTDNLHMDRQCKKTTNNLHMDRQCKKLHWSIYSAPDSAKKTTAIYIWTDSAKKQQQFTYGQYIFTDCTEDNVQNTKYSVHLVYYKDILNYQWHIIHRMGTSTLCTVSIHNVVYTRDGSRLSNIRIFYFIIEYRLGCAIIF